jgi:hypothetical protein
MPYLDTILKLAGALSIPASELIQGMVWGPEGFGPSKPSA